MDRNYVNTYLYHFIQFLLNTRLLFVIFIVVLFIKWSSSIDMQIFPGIKCHKVKDTFSTFIAIWFWVEVQTWIFDPADYVKIISNSWTASSKTLVHNIWMKISSAILKISEIFKVISESELFRFFILCIVKKGGLAHFRSKLE